MRPDISPVVTDRACVLRCRRSLALAVGWCCCCHRCCQPSAGRPVESRPVPCRGWPASGPGRLPPGPCFLTGSVRRGSRIKCDFACTFTSQFPPVLVVLRSQSRLRLEGRTRTLSGPSPDLSPARARLVTRSPPPSQPVPGPAADGRVRVPGSGPPMSSRNGGYLSVISPA